MRLLLIAVLGWLLAVAPVNACMGTRPTANPEHIDAALAQAKITPEEKASVLALREKMAEAIAFRDFKGAEKPEDEAMKILHFKLDYRSGTRGCQGQWRPAQE
jgi:hypothetical protein